MKIWNLVSFVHSSLSCWGASVFRASGLSSWARPLVLAYVSQVLLWMQKTETLEQVRECIFCYVFHSILTSFYATCFNPPPTPPEALARVFQQRLQLSTRVWITETWEYSFSRASDFGGGLVKLRFSGEREIFEICCGCLLSFRSRKKIAAWNNMKRPEICPAPRKSLRITNQCNNTQGGNVDSFGEHWLASWKLSCTAWFVNNSRLIWSNPNF